MAAPPAALPPRDAGPPPAAVQRRPRPRRRRGGRAGAAVEAVYLARVNLPRPRRPGPGAGAVPVDAGGAARVPLRPGAEDERTGVGQTAGGAVGAGAAVTVSTKVPWTRRVLSAAKARIRLPIRNPESKIRNRMIRAFAARRTRRDQARRSVR